MSLLAGLWALFVPLAIAGTLLGAARLQAGWLGWLGAGLLAAVAAGLGTSMALGLRALAPWARHLQIASAAVALLVCPFTLAAATVLLYMARPEVKGAFEGTTPALGGPTPESAEPTFALSLVGLLLLGLALHRHRRSCPLAVTQSSLTPGLIHSKKGSSPAERRRRLA